MNPTKHLRKILELRVTEFIAVGATGAAVQLSILHVLTEVFGIKPVFSNIVGIETSILAMLYLNNRFTFSDTIFKGKNVFESILRTNMVRLSGTAANLSVFYALNTFLGTHYILSAVLGIGTGFIFNYIGERNVTWKL